MGKRQKSYSEHWILILMGLSVLVWLFFIVGCGAGGSSDTPRNTDQDYPVVESNFRDIMLEWQPNSEDNLAGYKVFMRAEGDSYDYGNPEWETIDTGCAFYSLDKHITYHFVVRAFSTEGDESGYSNEATLNSL